MDMEEKDPGRAGSPWVKMKSLDPRPSAAQVCGALLTSCLSHSAWVCSSLLLVPTRSHHRSLVSLWTAAVCASDVYLWPKKFWLGGGDGAQFYGRKRGYPYRNRSRECTSFTWKELWEQQLGLTSWLHTCARQPYTSPPSPQLLQTTKMPKCPVAGG